jgi:hypothetical protein
MKRERQNKVAGRIERTNFKLGRVVMVVRNIDRNAIGLNEDWEGNNAAFSCPACNKVFIVSALLHGGQRECPNCGKSKGFVHGSKQTGGSASIKWGNAN